MSPRKSFQALSWMLIALSLLSSACSSQKGFITRQQVVALLDEMEKAAKNRDIEALISYISPKAQFKVTIEGFGPQPQTMMLNRDQYREYSLQALNAIETYDFKRGDTVINIDPDGQTAFVADESYETVTMRGRVISTVIRGTSTLKLEDGKLVLVSSESVGRPAPVSPSANRVSFK